MPLREGNSLPMVWEILFLFLFHNINILSMLSTQKPRTTSSEVPAGISRCITLQALFMGGETKCDQMSSQVPSHEPPNSILSSFIWTNPSDLCTNATIIPTLQERGLRNKEVIHSVNCPRMPCREGAQMALRGFLGGGYFGGTCWGAGRAWKIS